MKYTEIKHAKSYKISIYIAGDYQKAVEACKTYCDEVGFCVSVTQTEYVYTGGNESGVIIGLINYPRFPSDGLSLVLHAREIGDLLLERLDQQSYSIETPETTHWYSRR